MMASSSDFSLVWREVQRDWMEVGSRKFIVGCCSVRGERGVRTVVIVYSVCICAEDNYRTYRC